MTLFSKTIVVLIVVLATLTACAPSVTPAPTATAVPPAETPVITSDGIIDTAVELHAALENEGLVVESAGVSEAFILEHPAQLLQVDGEQISVWEYATIEEADAARLYLTGPNSPLALMDFIAAPRFFQSGSMVVLYVSTNSAIMDALITILGDPFI